MIEINKSKIKTWSTIGQRATFGLVAYEIANKIKDLIILTCDVSTSAGLDRFRKNFPENFIELGISEQNMIGVASALSNENHKIITTSFAPFQTMRCCEQIKVNLGYMKQKVSMVGLASGLALGALGFTHCCIEDIGALRSIPNIDIVVPSDSLETIKVINAMVESKNSTYVRLTGISNNTIINKENYDFEIGKSILLRDGKDVVIFSNGAVLGECLKAAEALEKKKISCRVINMHTVKPIDSKAVTETKNFKLIVSVEEHNVIGGLGSAISECLSKEPNTPRQVFIGANDYYEKGGSYKYLLDRYGLSSEKIVENILSTL
jgi:transketolase